MSTTATVERSTAGNREWAGLAVLAMANLLLAIDMNVLHMALPQLAADLRPTSVELLWIVDMYSFMVAGFLVTMGTLGDRIGRRRLLIIGAAAFGVASLVAAFATSAVMLIVARTLLGIAGAAVMPSTLSLVSNMFTDRRQRTFAISVWMVCFEAGAVTGPVLGGLVLEFFWWGAVFLLGIPVMAVLLVTAPKLLPEYRDPDAGKLDLLSVALSLATVLPVVYGIKTVAKEGVGTTAVLAVLAGLAFGTIFVLRQRKLRSPFVDLRLFRVRSFSAALAVMLLGIVAFSGVVLFVVQYLQLVEGLSPLRAGLWMTPAVIASAASTMLAPALARRLSPATVIACGLGIASIGYLVLTQVEPVSGLTVLITGAVIGYAGTGPMLALGLDLVVASAPPRRAGSASGLGESSAELGSALGVAVLGSIGTAVYRADLAAADPATVPPEAVAALSESVAGAGQLPADLAAEVLRAGRSAFTNGLNVVGAVSAALLAGLAVLAAITLRPGAAAKADERTR